MRLKYYLRGAGIAMICAAVLFLIAQRAVPSESAAGETEAATEREPSIAEAIRNRSTETETESEEEDSEDRTAITEQAGTGTTEAEEEDSEQRTVITEHTRTETPGTEETPETEEKDTDREPPRQTAPTEIVIYRGEGPTAVAERLQAAGAIESAEDFVTYLRQVGKTDYLEVGHFSIPAGSDYDAIATILTTSEDERQ